MFFRITPCTHMWHARTHTTETLSHIRNVPCHALQCNSILVVCVKVFPVCVRANSGVLHGPSYMSLSNVISNVLQWRCLPRLFRTISAIWGFYVCSAAPYMSSANTFILLFVRVNKKSLAGTSRWISHLTTWFNVWRTVALLNNVYCRGQHHYVRQLVPRI